VYQNGVHITSVNVGSNHANVMEFRHWFEDEKFLHFEHIYKACTKMTAKFRSTV